MSRHIYSNDHFDHYMNQSHHPLPPPQPIYRRSLPYQTPPPPPTPPTPQFSRTILSKRTYIYGIVIGFKLNGKGNFLFYSRHVPVGIIEIDRKLNLEIGIWSWVTVYIENYNGEVTLDHHNSNGLNDIAEQPDTLYCFSKYFPKRLDRSSGELIIAARFTSRYNKRTKAFYIESYEIKIEHIIDPLGLIQKSDDDYDGRSFVVEAQACERGWIALKLHEEPSRRIHCSELSQSYVNFEARFLEDLFPPLKSKMSIDIEHIESLESKLEKMKMEMDNLKVDLEKKEEELKMKNEKMDDLLRCSICYYKFDNIKRLPTTLMCGHTMCKECFHIIKENKRCPTCRRRFGAFEMSTNYLLLDILSNE